jgi:hypothetical protein
MLTGEWRLREVDHVDLDRTNNRPSNLRLANEPGLCGGGLPVRQEANRPPPFEKELVLDFVKAGHTDLDKVRTMLDERPRLINATWDWSKGDFDFNTTTDTVDFNLLAASYGQTGRHWNNGDSNYDGGVDSTDFNRLAANFGGALPADSFGTIIPEPHIAAASFAGMLALRRRRAAAIR